MPSASQGSRGRKPLPSPLARREWLRTRVSPLEHEAVKARACAAGLNVSDYVRRECCGSFPEENNQASTKELDEPGAPESYEAMVARHSRTMPRRNAEFLARKELGQ